MEMTRNYFGLIYKITNLINNKKYIGQTTSTLEKRFYQHCHTSSGKNTSALQMAIKKYGANNFSIELLVLCLDKNALDYWECFYMNKYDTLENGYNLTTGKGNGGHSLETRKKIGEKARISGNWKTGVLAAQKANKNRVLSEETKKKMSHAKRGIRMSQEAREKMSIAKKGKPSNRKETKLSEAIKAKISATLTGKSYLTDEGRKRISQNSTGRKHTEEVKQKLSEAKMGNKNPMFGVTPKHIEILRIKVIRDDGVQYESLTAAAIALNVTVAAVRRVLDKPEYKCKGHSFNSL